MSSLIVLMNTQRIERSVKRMGYEMVEQNTENLPFLLFGIDHRGFAVAQLLQEVLDEISNDTVQAVRLPVKEDFDDEILKKVSDKKVKEAFPIIVDDVIFSGKTMFEALKKIADWFNPPQIHTAVMVDRGHRKFPIEAEFLGMELPTKFNEHVSVVINDTGIERITLEKA